MTLEYMINGDYQRPDEDWCERCLKPSMLISPIYVLSERGVRFWGWYVGCKEEKKFEKIPRQFDAEDYEKVTKFMSNRRKIKPPKKPITTEEIPEGFEVITDKAAVDKNGEAPEGFEKVETIYIEGNLRSDELPKAKCTCTWETEPSDNLLTLGLAAKQHALETGHQLRQHGQDNW